MSELWPWLAVFGLGIFHGVNPAMGWLFAVALGLQEQRRAAVFRALPPMVLGHALSIGIIIAVVLMARVSRSASRSENCRCRDPLCLRFVSSTAFASSELGGDAGRLRRFDALVFRHGVSAWRRVDARPVFFCHRRLRESRITTMLTKHTRGHSRILARLVCSSQRS